MRGRELIVLFLLSLAVQAQQQQASDVFSGMDVKFEKGFENAVKPFQLQSSGSVPAGTLKRQDVLSVPAAQMPVWAIVVASLLSAAVLFSVGLIVFGCMSKSPLQRKDGYEQVGSSEKSTRKLPVILGIVLLVFSVGGLAATLGVGLTMRQTGVARATFTTSETRILTVSNAGMVDGEMRTTLQPMVVIFNTQYIVKYVPGLAPVPTGVPVVLEGTISDDERFAVVSRYELLPVPRQASTNSFPKPTFSPSGKKSLLVIRLSIPGLQEACSFDTIHSQLFSQQDSANWFYKTVSRGAIEFTTDRSKWLTVQWPDSKFAITSIGKRIEAKMGSPLPPADHYVMYMPPNFVNQDLPANYFGQGMQKYPPGSNGPTNPVWTWIKDCSSPFLFSHEFAHNLGLDHAGFLDNGKFNELADPTQIMSYHIRNAQPIYLRGLSAPQLYDLSWLPESSVMNIDKDGTYKIDSISRNAGLGAARFLFSGQVVWLEWREPINQDRDLQLKPLVDFWRSYGKGLTKGTEPLKSLIVRVFGTYQTKIGQQTFTMGPVSQCIGAVSEKQSKTFFGRVKISYNGAGSFSISGLQ